MWCSSSPTITSDRFTSTTRASSAATAESFNGRLAAVVSAGTLFFHLLTVPGYGYFRDELYYLACGRHLGFGYVDHPPLIGLIAALVRTVAGESLPAIRFLPALAAALTVWVAARITAELGGGRYAQVLAAVAVALAPVYLSLFTLFSMNAFDVLFWALGWWILVRLFAGGDERLWLLFGLVAGLGLQNKISMLFLGFGLAVGLVLARRWEILRSRWIWLGGGLALLVFAPHLVWQQVHGWPTLEFMDNARQFKNVEYPPLDFLAAQVLNAGPQLLPIWLSGLIFFLFVRAGRPFRALGWAYVGILVLMIVQGAKPYYLSPAYTILFAGGAVALERWTSFRFGTAIRATVLGFAVVLSLFVAPIAKPLLPVDLYVRYAAKLGFGPSTDEHHELGRLPQFFADMHGWRDMAESVGLAWAKLSPADQSVACVYGGNYGEAGAVDLFGPEIGLPAAISGAQQLLSLGAGGLFGRGDAGDQRRP